MQAPLSTENLDYILHRRMLDRQLSAMSSPSSSDLSVCSLEANSARPLKELFKTEDGDPPIGTVQ